MQHCEIDNNDVIFIKQYNDRYTWLTSYKCNDFKSVFFYCNLFCLSRASRYQKNNNSLILERGVKYHKNTYHLFDVSKNQHNSYFKDIIVNYEDTNKNE